MKAPIVTPEEHKAIAAVIRAAERRTSGEIYCVLARASDSYFFPASLMLVLAMLVVGFVVALVLESLWLTMRLPVFLAAQLLALGAAMAVLKLSPGLRLRLVPRRWQYRHAHENALKQFLARNVHITAERTGVLIFVSLAEHYAEIVADAGINARVEQRVWDGIVAELVDHARRGRLADGFVAAVGRVGALLAEDFPVSSADRNELDDHLVEL
jgi:putative membrane protein